MMTARHAREYAFMQLSKGLDIELLPCETEDKNKEH
jgi:hypothetical protein